MPHHVARVTHIISESPVSFEDAIRLGFERAIKVPAGYILSSGDTTRDIELRDGDSVVIPESWF